MCLVFMFLRQKRNAFMGMKVGCDPDDIRAVSGDDVLQGARIYLKPNDVISSIVADLEKTDLEQ